MTIAIKVENISKRYKIGLATQRFQYGMLRDVLVDATGYFGECALREQERGERAGFCQAHR